jgi:hypothetical protein
MRDASVNKCFVSIDAVAIKVFKVEHETHNIVFRKDPIPGAVPSPFTRWCRPYSKSITPCIHSRDVLSFGLISSSVVVLL